MPQGVVLPVQPPSMTDRMNFRSLVNESEILNDNPEAEQGAPSRILYYIVYSSKSEDSVDLNNLDTIIPVVEQGNFKVDPYDLVEFNKTGVIVIRTNAARVLRVLPNKFPFFKIILKAGLVVSLLVALGMRILKKK